MSLLKRLTAAHTGAKMVGWDFSALDGRLEADHPPWDFDAMCRAAWPGAHSLLDIGTGWGERLRALCEQAGPQRPLRLQATEGWAPNVTIAREALKPSGVTVAEYDSESGEPMPFESQSFDVVLARHESYDAREVARVLRPGGRFLTQQVHGLDADELRTWFGGEPVYPDATLECFADAAVDAGLIVDGQGQWRGQMVFKDAEALVQYIGLVPWDVPEFTVEPHLSKLTELDAARPIVVSQRRFWLAARKQQHPEEHR